MDLLRILRKLPSFKGKYKIGSLLAKNILNKQQPVSFTIKNNICFTIPNTIETVGKQLLINGVYEKKTIDLIIGYLQKSSVFFDVGANIGSISIPVARVTRANVYSFEPSHLSFRFLEKNVRDNHLNTITIHNNAVHSIHGIELQFYEAEEKYGNSSLSSIYNQQPHYSTTTISLDEYCKLHKIATINVLKVDVQGYEIEVLKGAQKLISNKRVDVIIFEMEPWAEKQAGYKAGASQEFLLKNGYELFSLGRKKLTKVQTEESQMFLAMPKK